MLRRLGSALAACFLCLIMLGADSSRFNRIGHDMICVCGCSQVLLECNHVGCPDSDRMIGELRQQMAGGGSDTSILNWFAAKYGPTVLAAPIRGGFDNVAWITPFAVFLLATVGTAILMTVWKGRSLPRAIVAGSPLAKANELREQIRRETQF